MERKNMIYWEQMNQPTRDAIKVIEAGRLRGMSDINPQWRMEVMTQVFGPCGIGWYYTVDKKWLEPGSDDQVCAFVDVTVYIKVDGEWSMGIPGSGGSMLIAKESKGLHTSDEAYKMAITDALSVAFKALGVAANVYRGFENSGSKHHKNYQANQPQQPQPKKPAYPFKSFTGALDRCKNIDALSRVWNDKQFQADVKTLPESDQKKLLAHKEEIAKIFEKEANEGSKG